VERWWNGYSTKARYIAKLTVVQPVTTLRTFYRYRRFGTGFLTARHWFLDSSECSSYIVVFSILFYGAFVFLDVSKDHSIFILVG